MRIHVHVGVHKTGSTFIQNCLAANRAELNSLGIGYMPLINFRSGFTQNLKKLSTGGLRIDQISKYFFEGPGPAAFKGLILSDENLVGDSLEIAFGGRPLMSGAHRLVLLRKILEGHEVTLFMAVRDYGDYIASSYSEALRAMPQFTDFETVKNRLNAEAFDWPAIIKSFRESLMPAHVRIWRFEDARNNLEAVARAIAFDFSGSLNPTDQQGRYSLPQKVIDELHCIAAEAGQAAATMRLDEIRSTFGEYAGAAPYRPWSQAEKQQWSEKYDVDCTRIDSSLWLIRPHIGRASRYRHSQAQQA